MYICMFSNTGKQEDFVYVLKSKLPSRQSVRVMSFTSMPIQSWPP